MLGRILHNWDLDTKKMLLKKAHGALPSGGALIVYERLIDDERRRNAPALLASLNMLIMTGGRERTESEFRKLYEDSGFKLTRVVPTESPFSVIEGVKS